ncbi:cytotoxic T-lymphocyte protein 4 [Thunnus albacares]|uniref:cytotoxic T-lymphocyte protein 4 n=1 Tax=Thunnus albacares TaxID=8236 RepID=UPI001CF66D32|nr:cytotoxic T-lymphocyte protein 4 [Thunnus albacares]
MQKFKMRVCWIFMILLGCRLSHASESKSSCPCDYKVKTVCVPAGDIVSIPCPDMNGEDMTFSLLKNNEVIYNQTCNFGKPTSNCKLNDSMGVALHEHNKSVRFNLTGVNDNSHGLYRCEVIVTYPPPYIKEGNVLWILVLVQGHQCNVSSPGKPEPLVVPGLHWIWICVSVVLIIYSTAVTIIAVVNYMKFKHSDSQNDYMNTKPRAPKDRKKKRGLENPIPRHF